MAHLEVDDRVEPAECGDTWDDPSVALRLIASLLLVGAAWLMAHLLVPFVLAMVLAIALSPVADRLERWRWPRTLAALACMLAVASVIVAGAGLLAFQAGRIASDSDRYINRFGQMLDDVTRSTQTGRLAGVLGFTKTSPAEKGTGEGTPDADADAAEDANSSVPPGGWEASLRDSLGVVGRWLVSGVGGLLGVAGGGVVFLAALFYMLQTRGEWVDRLTAAARRLGMEPRGERLQKVREEVVTFVGCLAMVSLGYVVVVSLVLWALGVPQPLLWGAIAGLFEVVPYFGPLIASICPTLVSLSLGVWWKPVVVAGVFLLLHLVEGYLITPLLYGRAVRFDPVTILFGALFFGWLWGPVGLATAMPMLIILRGLLVITPGTPALDALADVGPAEGKRG